MFQRKKIWYERVEDVNFDWNQREKFKMSATGLKSVGLVINKNK